MLVPVRDLLVIDAEQTERRRLEVVHVHAVPHHVLAERVRLPV